LQKIGDTAGVPRANPIKPSDKEAHMDRYGADFYRRPMTRYGGEYQQWGAGPRYDYDYGSRGGRSGRFYDRDFSGYNPHGFGFRAGPRYDRGFMERGGYSHRPSYDQSYGGYNRGAWDEVRQMGGRRYPSPWDESHPGQTYGFGLGYGQGRGQFIYK
jgi:hypothetical protein